jgi:DNA-binding response OmpR family regulator
MYKRIQKSLPDSPRKVLIFDEDSLSGDIISKIITHYLGCEVNMASNEAGALSFLKSQDFDLVIVAITLTGMTGVKIIRNIQNTKPGLPLMIVCGNGTDHDLEILRSMGISKIVYKPLRISPLLEMVASAFMKNDQVHSYA